jgi:hypothetical protein
MLVTPRARLAASAGTVDIAHSNRRTPEPGFARRAIAVGHQAAPERAYRCRMIAAGDDRLDSLNYADCAD